MSKLTYINDQGNVVFTSTSLRNKKSCCHSTCLHCPYGTTLNKFGVKIQEVSEFSSDLVTKIVNELKPKSSLSNSLLSEAYGKEKELAESDLKILTLKGVICGICYIKNQSLQKFFLKSEFRDQGIEESYLVGLIN